MSQPHPLCWIQISHHASYVELKIHVIVSNSTSSNRCWCWARLGCNTGMSVWMSWLEWMSCHEQLVCSTDSWGQLDTMPSMANKLTLPLAINEPHLIPYTARKSIANKEIFVANQSVFFPRLNPVRDIQRIAIVRACSMNPWLWTVI